MGISVHFCMVFSGVAIARLTKSPLANLISVVRLLDNFFLGNPLF